MSQLYIDFLEEQRKIEDAVSTACWQAQDHAEVQDKTFRTLEWIMEVDDAIHASISSISRRNGH